MLGLEILQEANQQMSKLEYLFRSINQGRS